MSPTAKLPVEEGGGWSVDQIKNHVNEERRGLMADLEKSIDVKFAEFKRATDVSLKERDLEIAKRLNSQDLTLSEILGEVKGIRSQGDKWHGEDLSHRAQVKGELATVTTNQGEMRSQLEALTATVSAVETKQVDINSKFNLIQWLVCFCKGVSWTSDKTVAVADKGRKVYAALAAIFSGLVLVWSAVRPGGIIALLREWFKHHL